MVFFITKGLSTLRERERERKWDRDRESENEREIRHGKTIE